MSDRPLSVLMVSTTLNTGGAQRFTSTLLAHLDRTRFAPSLALLRRDIGYPLPDGVEVHTLGYRGCWDFVRCAGRLRRVIEQTRPDVVLSNITATNLVAGYAMRSLKNRPKWIARIGNSPRRHDGMFRFALARQLYPMADHIVCNSHGLRDEFLTVYPLDRNRISVLGNPTDFEEIDRRAAEPPEHCRHGDDALLISVGRLAPQKRNDVLLNAFKIVSRTNNVRLWICGDGPCRGALERQVQSLQLRNCVELLGFCRNPFALMRQADLFVLSSDHEGLPNALIEAQGLGLPVISTDCPHGPREIIAQRKTGFLVPVRDPRKLAQAITTMLHGNELRQQISWAARQSVHQRLDVNLLAGYWQALIASTKHPKTSVSATLNFSKYSIHDTA